MTGPTDSARGVAATQATRRWNGRRGGPRGRRSLLALDELVAGARRPGLRAGRAAAGGVYFGALCGGRGGDGARLLKT